ncbi:hypothetical protein [Marilutibacter alkalisoli]|uniref:Uncharacterized protein n=1 Tax=Marilutibacter alkalisoli TaxID=2591633 RepID=A0A514BQJ6_9GAMM|nr:hypothetical protein [Lysobacter alkalisoli]QDH69673.1 hypothetical protein FKV23_05875 [Lysobacter alkalisoli]
MTDALIPMIIALSGLPALGIAWWNLRTGDMHSRGSALRWAMIAIAIFIGALALYWAGDSKGWAMAVVAAMVVAVNVLLVSLLLHLRRGGPRDH